MGTRMTVTMDGAAGRRYGGRSRFRGPVLYPSRKAALEDLRNVFGGLFHQPEADYLKALREVGISVTLEDA